MVTNVAYVISVLGVFVLSGCAAPLTGGRPFDNK